MVFLRVKPSCGGSTANRMSLTDEFILLSGLPTSDDFRETAIRSHARWIRPTASYSGTDKAVSSSCRALPDTDLAPDQ